MDEKGAQRRLRTCRKVGREAPQTEVGQLHLPKIRAREEEEGDTSFPGQVV